LHGVGKTEKNITAGVKSTMPGKRGGRARWRNHRRNKKFSSEEGHKKEDDEGKDNELKESLLRGGEQKGG